MKFEWDDRKARTNLAKHGVSFETAALALKDPGRVERYQRERGEDRWIVYCRRELKIYVVVYTDKQDVVRIISAREAEKHEQKTYYRKGG